MLTSFLTIDSFLVGDQRWLPQWSLAAIVDASGLCMTSNRYSRNILLDNVKMRNIYSSTRKFNRARQKLFNQQRTLAIINVMRAVFR